MYTAPMRILSVGTGLLIALTLVFGGSAHTLVPHTHSHAHSAGESVIWQSLHSALRHEDKSILPALPVLAIIAAVVGILIGRVPAERIIVVDSRFEYLRRGISPDRRFA